MSIQMPLCLLKKTLKTSTQKASTYHGFDGQPVLAKTVMVPSNAHGLAWGGCRGLESSACGKGLLRWLSAGKAARLAPAEEAISLAVLGPVLAGCCVTLGATGADAGRGAEARVELVMVEVASEHVVRAGAAVVGLLAGNLRISESGLLISVAGTSGGQLLAWGGCRGLESCACGKGLLRWLSARKAARLAPAEEAISLAVLGTVLTGCGVALRATRADAGRGGEA